MIGATRGPLQAACNDVPGLGGVMSVWNFHYFPLALPFLLLLVALFGLVVAVVAVRILRFASFSMGIGPRTMLAILLASLLGSYVNIPIAYLPQRQITTAAEVTYFGMRYVIPFVSQAPATVIAINLGGAIVPIALSIFLIVRNELYVSAGVGIVVVTAICNALARPVPGLGIALPALVPALATAAVSLLISVRRAAPLAYVSGSLGTLIGADLLNLGKIQGLGAPIASIGGAGTFDGIFLTGLLAVVYASIIAPSSGPHFRRRYR
jgi:uncharacterized membrane protein